MPHSYSLIKSPKGYANLDDLITLLNDIESKGWEPYLIMEVFIDGDPGFAIFYKTPTGQSGVTAVPIMATADPSFTLK